MSYQIIRLVSVSEKRSIAVYFGKFPEMPYNRDSELVSRARSAGIVYNVEVIYIRLFAHKDFANLFFGKAVFYVLNTPFELVFKPAVVFFRSEPVVILNNLIPYAELSEVIREISVRAENNKWLDSVFQAIGQYLF